MNLPRINRNFRRDGLVGLLVGVGVGFISCSVGIVVAENEEVVRRYSEGVEHDAQPIADIFYALGTVTALGGAMYYLSKRNG